MTASTECRKLRKAGLKVCVSARKPLLRVFNKRKRFAWVEEQRNWGVEGWCKVLSTDESKSEIYGFSRRCYVHRCTGEGMLPQIITCTAAWRRQGDGLGVLC